MSLQMTSDGNWILHLTKPATVALTGIMKRIKYAKEFRKLDQIQADKL